MDKSFFRTVEVAGFLGVSAKTLLNMASKKSALKPVRPGIWHRRQLPIIERVWAGILTNDEGVALWELEKIRMRREYAKDLDNCA